MITLAGSPTIHLHVTKMEMAIQDHPLVRAALIGGEGKRRPFRLLEPAEVDSVQNGSEGSNLNGSGKLTVDAIYSAVSAANQLTIEDAHILRSMILFADPQRPFLRVTKGSVVRRRTLALYQEDIERLYD